MRLHEIKSFDDAVRQVGIVPLASFNVISYEQKSCTEENNETVMKITYAIQIVLHGSLELLVIAT